MRSRVGKKLGIVLAVIVIGWGGLELWRLGVHFFDLMHQGIVSLYNPGY